MTDPLALGQRLLSLLEESALSSTYKPALLLALVDRVQEHPDGRLPVRALAERVIELYWPQTLSYPTTGAVLLQNNAGGQARIVKDVASFRRRHGLTQRTLPDALRREPAWQRLVGGVERTLAEWPIPRLQRPYEPFLYTFDWPWAEAGRWTATAYEATDRAVRLLPGVAAGLDALGPLLRPFIVRWWTDKAARLNPDVEAARSVLAFEDFLFGRDRAALGRIAEGLLDLQGGRCLYCGAAIGKDREVDHVVPWSASGDDGLHNLVAACRRCNNEKRATLPALEPVTAVLDRNARWAADLAALAAERQWPADERRSAVVRAAAYARLPHEAWLWRPREHRVAGTELDEIRALLAA